MARLCDIGWFPTACFTAFMVLASPIARAEEGDAAAILKKMTDYVTRQDHISAAYDTDIEIITPELQKIQFASSSQLSLERPGKLRVSRTGGYANVDLIFDGKTISILATDRNVFAQFDATGSIDDLVDKLRSELAIEAPGADLLLSGAYDEMMKGVLDAKHIGRGVIAGIECEHLAFRNADTDWQIWIEVGPKPIPRKYVITSKAVTGAPQYTLRIRDWQTDTPPAPDAFVFKAPADAKKLDVKEMPDIDEVPPGVVEGDTR
jgi:hypothetical protein